MTEQQAEQEHAYTLDQIAEHLGVSHQYVWEVEKRALNKIRQEFAKRNIDIRDLI